MQFIALLLAILTYSQTSMCSIVQRPLWWFLLAFARSLLVPLFFFTLIDELVWIFELVGLWLVLLQSFGLTRISDKLIKSRQGSQKRVAIMSSLQPSFMKDTCVSWAAWQPAIESLTPDLVNHFSVGEISAEEINTPISLKGLSGGFRVRRSS